MPTREHTAPKTPPGRRLTRTDVPGVYRRGSRYVAITQRHGRRTKSSHRTKTEARKAKSERQAGARPASRERFEDYVERWLEEYTGRTARGLAPSTRAAYTWTMRTYVVPYFAGRRLGDLGPADVKAFVTHLTRLPPRRAQRGATRLAASTVRRIMTPLKAMLAEAYELEHVAYDIGRVRIIVPASRPASRPKTLDDDQIAAVMRELSEGDRLLFELLRWTGLRISEALGLRWRDVQVDADGAVLTVHRQWHDGDSREETKTPAGTRRVALVPSLAGALATARENVRFCGDDDPIFATRRGTPRDSHNVRRSLRPAARRAGLSWVTPHVFRHTLATRLVEHGYDTGMVAKVLGHRSEAFTRRVYVHTREVPRFDELDP